jgi:hypothetical protein
MLQVIDVRAFNFGLFIDFRLKGVDVGSEGNTALAPDHHYFFQSLALQSQSHRSSRKPPFAARSLR